MRVLEDIWWQYPYAVDFLIYFLFFAALVRAALTRHFGEDSAKRLGVAIGLAMAAGLRAGQYRFGFELEQLGPAAVWLIVAALAITVYRLFGSGGISGTYAAVVAGVYSLVIIHTLELELGFQVPRLDSNWVLLAIIAAGVWIWKSAPVASSPGAGRRWAPALPTRPELGGVGKELKRAVRDQKRDGIRAGKESAQAIKKVERSESDPNDADSRRSIERAMQTLQESASRLAAQTARVQRLDRALTETDWAWLQRAAKIDVRGLTPQQRRAVKEAVALERARLDIESRVGTLAQSAEAHTLRARDLIREAEDHRAKTPAQDRQRLLAQARQEQENANTTSRGILALERQLLQLVRRQMKRAP